MFSECIVHTPSVHFEVPASNSPIILTSDLMTGVRSPAEARDSSPGLCVQTRSGAHPASSPKGTAGPFPGSKARPGRDDDQPLTPI
jgi:hypothetical protein